MERIFRNIFGSFQLSAPSSIKVKNPSMHEVPGDPIFDTPIIPSHRLELIKQNDLYLLMLDPAFRRESGSLAVQIFAKFWEFRHIHPLPSSCAEEERYALPTQGMYCAYAQEAIDARRADYLRNELISYFLIYFQEPAYVYLCREVATWQFFNFYNEDDVTHFKYRFVEFLDIFLIGLPNEQF